MRRPRSGHDALVPATRPAGTAPTADAERQALGLIGRAGLVQHLRSAIQEYENGVGPAGYLGPYIGRDVLKAAIARILELEQELAEALAAGYGGGGKHGV